MKKIIIVTSAIIVVAVFIIIGFGVYKFNFTNDDIYIATGGKIDSKDGTYSIDGEAVTLKNGYYEKVIVAGAATKEITRYFGNEVAADFNNDGVNDAAFLLTRESGGSGTFFYIVAQLSKGQSFVGTNAIFIGDRIAPQSTEFRDGMIIVNYADRKPGESFSVSPSVGVSKYYRIIDNKLTEVALK